MRAWISNVELAAGITGMGFENSLMPDSASFRDYLFARFLTILVTDNLEFSKFCPLYAIPNAII